MTSIPDFLHTAWQSVSAWTFPDWLVPTWPDSSRAIAAFVLIFLMGLFKLDRGTLMKRRSAYIDHFGASIITFDLVFAVTFLAGSVEALYPRIGDNGLVFWATLIPLFLALAWQWIEIRIAAHERIAVSMGGPSAHGWQPGDPDRRGPLPGRRASDLGGAK
jgi:hypothetical protein